MIHLLIVEDDPMVAELNRRYVETIDGYKVAGIARDGEEALKQLKTKKIDIILLDVYMPKIDGRTLLRTIRSNHVLVDVILVTASKESETIDELLKMGAVDYLIKPFEYERLRSSLESYKARYELLNKSGEITQDEIDRITKVNFTDTSGSLQKGLHKNTLEKVREYMKNSSKELISALDIAEALSVSSVTIRRYLEYLISIGEAKLEIEYGAIGRPSYLYKYIGKWETNS